MISKSYAKINLSLKVLGTREDGYHLLEMINLPLCLHDIIIFERLPQSVGTHIVCDDPGLSSLKHNLCSKAFNLMKEKYGFSDTFLIKIHKEIPFAAGLGGGSSNAATVLMGLNKILHLGASIDELSEIGLKIGADVPFFLKNKPMEVAGIGETMKEIKIKRNWHILLVKPEKGVSTAEVYKICDSFPKTSADTALVKEGLAEFDETKIARGIGNDLMAPAESLLPEIGNVYSLLRKFGFPIVSMSGSGSCCFAMSKSEQQCKDAFHKLDKMGYVVRLTKILE